MLKPLSLSLSLAVAMAAGGVVKAGGHGGAMPAPQALPSAQVVATEQCGPAYTECLPAKKHCFKLPEFHMPKICLPKIPKKTYTYEWVLKKKRCGGGLMGMFDKHHGGDAGYGGGWAEPVYATGQTVAAPSSQAWSSGQGGAAYGSGQIYGAGQATTIGSGQLAPSAPGVMEPAPVEAGDEAPEAPIIPSSFGRLGSR